MKLILPPPFLSDSYQQKTRKRGFYSLNNKCIVIEFLSVYEVSYQTFLAKCLTYVYFILIFLSLDHYTSPPHSLERILMIFENAIEIGIFLFKKKSSSKLQITILLLFSYINIHADCK